MCNTTTIGWSLMGEVGSVFVETVDLIPSRVSFVVMKTSSISEGNLLRFGVHL